MDIDVILCNHAESAENKLFITGGGINLSYVRPEPPHLITVGLGHVIHVPYQLTNQSHELQVTLLDEDAKPVRPYSPDNSPPPSPVQVKVPFNVGRPPLVAVGDEQTIVVATNFVNLPLTMTGLYTFEVQIDGTMLRRLPLRVLTPPPGALPTQQVCPELRSFSP